MNSTVSKDWIGSRGELLNVISNFENKNPEIYLLRSKTAGKNIPVTSRRIQQFMDEAIIPKGISKFEKTKRFN